MLRMFIRPVLWAGVVVGTIALLLSPQNPLPKLKAFFGWAQGGVESMLPDALNQKEAEQRLEDMRQQRAQIRGYLSTIRSQVTDRRVEFDACQTRVTRYEKLLTLLRDRLSATPVQEVVQVNDERFARADFEREAAVLLERLASERGQAAELQKHVCVLRGIEEKWVLAEREVGQKIEGFEHALAQTREMRRMTALFRSALATQPPSAASHAQFIQTYVAKVREDYDRLVGEWARTVDPSQGDPDLPAASALEDQASPRPSLLERIEAALSAETEKTPGLAAQR